MSKPDDIPLDVWDAVQKADAECQRNSCKRSECNGFLCRNAVDVAMMAATERERERCLAAISGYPDAYHALWNRIHMESHP